MSLEKFFWKFVILVSAVTVAMGGVFLSRDMIWSYYSANVVQQSVAEVQSLLGKVLSVDEVHQMERLLMISSKVKDLQMTWDGRPVSARLVIDPQLRGVQGSVAQESVDYQWLFSVPQDDERDISQLCLKRPETSAVAQCYRFQRVNALEALATTCGNAVVESGEQCDDGNTLDADQCDSKCLKPLLRAGNYEFPRPEIVARVTDRGKIRLLAYLREYPQELRERGDVSKMFLRLTVNGDLVITSLSTDRINGSPFLSTTVERGDALLLELVYRDGDLELIPLAQVVDLENPENPVLQDLKSAATEFPRDSFQIASLDLASIDWLGSQKTLLDLQGQQAIDVSPEGRGFLTRVAVRSLADEEMSVSARLLDQQVSFTHQIPPLMSDELVLNVADLPYGSHRLQMTARFADGEKIADVVIPFEYLPASFFGQMTFRYQPWQIAGIAVLLLLGAMYVVVRGVRIVGAMRGEGT